MSMLRIVFAVPAVCLCASIASAEPFARRAIEIVKTVCVAPTSPTDILAAGERMAAASQWVLDEERSGKHRGPGQSAGELPAFIDRLWHIKEPSLDAALTIRIIGPDYPGQRFTACSLRVAGRKFGEIATEVKSTLKLGQAITESGADQTVATWILAGDGKNPDKGYKFLTVGTRNWQTGWATDVGIAEVKSQDGTILGEKF